MQVTHKALVLPRISQHLAIRDELVKLGRKAIEVLAQSRREKFESHGHNGVGEVCQLEAALREDAEDTAETGESSAPQLAFFRMFGEAEPRDIAGKLRSL